MIRCGSLLAVDAVLGRSPNQHHADSAEAMDQASGLNDGRRFRGIARPDRDTKTRAFLPEPRLTQTNGEHMDAESAQDSDVARGNQRHSLHKDRRTWIASQKANEFAQPGSEVCRRVFRCSSSRLTTADLPGLDCASLCIASFRSLILAVLFALLCLPSRGEKDAKTGAHFQL